MNEREAKKFIKGFFMISALLLVMAAVTVAVFDPFLHYHKPIAGLKTIFTKKEYQLNGVMDHLDYDAVMLGSSVTMNINSSDFDRAFDCNTVKAVASGARCSTLCYYLDKAYKHTDVKYVFWGLDPDQICYEVDAVPDQEQVYYMRDKNPLNDVNYLWSMNVLLEDIPNMIAMSRHADYDPGLAYEFASFSVFGTDQALSTHKPEGEMHKMLDTSGEEYQRRINANMDLVEELVAAHPETEFKFFFTVAGILWWDIHYRDGLMERYFGAWRNAVDRLDKYDNVTFYSGVFNSEECITDLSHYCDYCHADAGINALQAQSVINGDRIITMENVDEEIDILRNIVLSFENRLITDGNWDFLYE
ncbi:MAG: hypothetical protein IKR23_05915 [Lachnospiraceae bacterium]|nr:hypothetical protein [Lachnospiraceae bacterium]